MWFINVWHSFSLINCNYLLKKKQISQFKKPKFLRWIQPNSRKIWELSLKFMDNTLLKIKNESNSIWITFNWIPLIEHTRIELTLQPSATRRKKCVLTFRPQRHIFNRNNEKCINRWFSFVTTGKKTMYSKISIIDCISTARVWWNRKLLFNSNTDTSFLSGVELK